MKKRYIFLVILTAIIINSCKQQEGNGNPFFSKYDTPFEVPPFDKIKAEHFMPGFVKGFEEQKKKVLDDTYKGFIRSGAALSDDDKEKLRKINEELSLLSVQFGENLLAQTNDFKLIIEKKEDLSCYAAGYYSYIWCEILDTDAFQAFKETGDIFNRDIASKFESEILARGGTRDPLAMYIAFRGKEPGIDALLENRGLK